MHVIRRLPSSQIVLPDTGRHGYMYVIFTEEAPDKEEIFFSNKAKQKHKNSGLCLPMR